MLRCGNWLVAAVFIAGPAPAIAQDPQAVVNGLIQHELANQARQSVLEGRDLQEQLRLREASDVDVMAELARYCPAGAPPCPTEPPGALLREAARRGLITVAPSVPGTQCVAVWPAIDCSN